MKPSHLSLSSAQRRTTALAVAAALAVMGTTATAATLAEEAPLTGANASAIAVQEVVVTGTRDITRSAAESLSPIDVISAKDLQRTGQTDLRDALVKLLPSINRLAQAGDAANLTSALTLR
ncbi:MAG: TonB-dependent receptor, partial [Duganella sp.]